jgi:hypothetical protein
MMSQSMRAQIGALILATSGLQLARYFGGITNGVLYCTN